MALENVTPHKMACGIGQCPAVYVEDDGRHLIIIGKRVEIEDIASNIGTGEAAIRIDKALLVNIVGELMLIDDHL